MQVKIYEDGDRLIGEADLREVLADDEDEIEEALASLLPYGRYWTGGGAAPLFMLQRVP